MIYVHPDDVTIPENRIRREFDEKKLAELEDSILRIGLLNPITLEASGDTYVLRAGERRFRVIKKLIEAKKPFKVGQFNAPEDLVPALEFRDLTELQRLEIEVEENAVRADFTWKERDLAYAKLHSLRSLQNPEQTLTATATEILGKPAKGGQVSAIADSVIIAKHLHIPEVAAAKSSRDALKVITRIQEAGHRAKLAMLALSSDIPHKLIKGDSKDVLPTLPNGSFDVILTDPPYGVDADSFGDMASLGHAYKDSEKNFEGILAWFCDESYRVAKERAHAYVFCDLRRFDRLSTLMLLAGWTVFPTPLIWSKSNGMLPLPDHGPRRTYECILYARKGDRRTLSVKGDVINISSVRTLAHGAQKPVALYIDLLARSANPGDSVLDCFGGSGPILVAANRLRLVATYVEQNEEAFNYARTRVNNREIDDDAEEHDGLEDIPF